MTVSMLTLRLVVFASLVCAALGGGWKWEHLPLP